MSLSAPAATGGLTVNLSTDDAGVATVPAMVTVPQGATASAPIAVNGVAQI
jgi:hypothetical protein